MSDKQTEFHPMLAIGATGLASAAALMTGVAPAVADGVYAGLSFGVATGDAPIEDDGTPENYNLSGGVTGMFVGLNKDISPNIFVGGELAVSGPINGDPDGNASYDYSYGINWMVDAKARVGTNIGNVQVYGFAGMSFGSANNYWTDYQTHGVNFGLGAQTNIGDSMFVGAEIIQRNMSGDGPPSSVEKTSHRVISLRGGFRF